MKLRPPAVPLITVDPYFSVWSMADRLTDKELSHWTGKPNTILGIANIDGKDYRFMGVKDGVEAMEQVSLDVTALSTVYQFAAAGVKLTVTFMTPLLPDDYYLLTRPVTYLEVSSASTDGKDHQVKVSVCASEELCLDTKGQMAVTTETLSLKDGIAAVKMGSEKQEVLAKHGDDIRIDWGYFYLAVKGGEVSVSKEDMTYVCACAEVKEPVLFTFAYDDIESITYFHQNLKSYWNKDGETIETAIEKAYGDYDCCVKKAAAFSDDLFCKAVRAGGEKYAQMLELAYRQVIAAHKLVLDTNGDVLFISKECFSNGCAATVDVSYPSIPMFLYYNPELVKGMMRPIFKYAKMEAWPFDFAPHDVGTYPHLNGQAYSDGTNPEGQMPVEECGNMLVMAAAVSIAEKSTDFAQEHMDLLTQWADYLKEYGVDPANQLCTDDFAGHLAHNCNLSLKAIMALEGMSIIKDMHGQKEESESYHKAAQEMVEKWIKMAANGDGSYRLAFDRPGTFSMKYNVVWDKVFGSNLFPAEVIASEFASYKKRVNPYGMPLDNRETYTKSDWLVWTATLAQEKEDFMEFIAPLWDEYNYTPSRVPMSDWYQTITANQVGFQHRTVQGGLFIKMLDESKKCYYAK